MQRVEKCINYYEPNKSCEAYSAKFNVYCKDVTDCEFKKVLEELEDYKNIAKQYQTQFDEKLEQNIKLKSENKRIRDALNNCSHNSLRIKLVSGRLQECSTIEDIQCLATENIVNIRKALENEETPDAR